MMGLAFKPNIDDLRESPAAYIAQVLLSQGYDLVTVEPNIKEDSRFELIELDEALKSADVLAVLVKHSEFIDAAKKGDFSRAGVIDFCGLER